MSKYDVSGLPTEFFNPGELEVFLDLIAERKPKIIVEFGVNRGRNAAAVLRNFKFVKRYIGIDVTPDYVPAMRCQRGEVPKRPGELAEHDASVAIPTAPGVQIWPNIHNSNPDIQYDTATGVFTFLDDGFYWSVASWYLVGSTARLFYADAETSVDGGVTWVRGTDSLRIEQVANSGRTLGFPFAGFFPKGLKLRFVRWANGTGVTMQTVSADGSTCPASRLTTAFVLGRKVIDG